MRIELDSFRGEVPRLTARALPANAAQAAVNAKLASGDLDAWRQFLQVKSLTAAAPVRTIYLLNDRWLSWTQQVDVARGIIPGDNTFRTYITAPGLYARPQFTNYALATTGSEPYPVATRALGVPAPVQAPIVAVNVSAADESNVEIDNPSAETGTASWTVDTGSLVVYVDGNIAGLDAQAGTQFFGGGASVSSEAYQDIDLDALGIVSGQSLKVAWHQARGAAGSTATMRVEFYNSADVLLGSSALDPLAPASALTWVRREMTAPVPDAAVTARLVQVYARVGAGPVIDAYIDNISVNSIEYSNYFDGSSLTGWDVSPSFGVPGSSDVWRSVVVDAVHGWAPPCWRFGGDESIPWIHRDFATVNSPAVIVKFDFSQFDVGAGMQVSLFAADGGRGAAILLGPAGCQLRSCANWDDGGSSVETVGPALSLATDYTVTITAEQAESGKANVTLRVTTMGGVVVLDDVKFAMKVDGPRVAFRPLTGSLGGTWFVDNVFITVAAPKARDSVVSTATSYVYRFVNDLGDYGAPSSASDTVVRPDGGSVVVTTPTTAPPGSDSTYGLTLKQIFRAISGSGGTAFFLVAEIPLAQADFVDEIDDSVAVENEVLDSEEWDVPPDDLQGIIALPNGMMAGFRRNQLCLSVSGFPHAWRVRDRKTTDTDIVAIANIDNTIVIGTKSRVYTATGTSNDSYAMSAPGAPQACLSKRSMVFLDGVGVVFASPDGWVACAGSAGNVPIVTETIFKKDQWEALNPGSIVAAVHDGMLFWFSTGQTPDSGYCLDLRESGAGLIALSFHAEALFVDPLTDSLYLVLSAVNEPTDALLPVASSAPTISAPARLIFKFDGATDGSRLRYRWRGKLHLLPYPATFTIAEVDAADFTNLVVRIYGDGALLMTKVLGSRREFTLPALQTFDSYEIEFIGTSVVRTSGLAEDVMEL